MPKSQTDRYRQVSRERQADTPTRTGKQESLHMSLYGEILVLLPSDISSAYPSYHVSCVLSDHRTFTLMTSNYRVLKIFCYKSCFFSFQRYSEAQQRLDLMTSSSCTKRKAQLSTYPQNYRKTRRTTSTDWKWWRPFVQVNRPLYLHPGCK